MPASRFTIRTSRQYRVLAFGRAELITGATTTRPQTRHVHLTVPTTKKTTVKTKTQLNPLKELPHFKFSE